MIVTKYVHSCLLVETPKQTILIDPGSFSWDSHLLSPVALNRLDYIILTHSHGDHYSLPFLKALSAKFPHAEIITNEDLAKVLAAEKLPNRILTGTQPHIEVFEVAHEPMPLGLPTARNIGVHIEDLLTYPGDALSLGSSRDVMALPMAAPWGSPKQALDAVIKAKPKKVIPVHDWHWHKVARGEMYAMSKSLLELHGIEFIELENGVPVEF